MHRFLVPEELQPHVEYQLSPDQSRHLAKVLRVEEGAQVEIFDGKGTVGIAEVILVHDKRARVRVNRTQVAEQGSRIRLVFGLPKSAALDFLIRRATELGVAAFQPLQTDHSMVLKSWNPGRWQRVVGEVCKQCQSNALPELLLPISLAQWLKERDTHSLLYFCDEEKRQAPRPSIGKTSVDLLIGPEGGWSRVERERILGCGAQSMSLGRNRLRMETAAVVALTLAKSWAGEI